MWTSFPLYWCGHDRMLYNIKIRPRAEHLDRPWYFFFIETNNFSSSICLFSSNRLEFPKNWATGIMLFLLLLLLLLLFLCCFIKKKKKRGSNGFLRGQRSWSGFNVHEMLFFSRCDIGFHLVIKLSAMNILSGHSWSSQSRGKWASVKKTHKVFVRTWKNVIF